MVTYNSTDERLDKADPAPRQPQNCPTGACPEPRLRIRVHGAARFTATVPRPLHGSLWTCVLVLGQRKRRKQEETVACASLPRRQLSQFSVAVLQLPQKPMAKDLCM
ncbi:unnamed protein product [Arctogadus glacialis]